MGSGGARRALALLLLVAIIAASCGRRGLGRQYEYEEEIFLDLDGSATVVVNSSIAALVALRGLPLDTDPQERVDRDAIRAAYEAAGVEISRVSRPWRRDGRRFVQVVLELDDVTALPRVSPLAWSEVRYAPEGEQVRYTQRVGPAAGPTPDGVNWTGQELVGFRLHMPSRITFHNAPTREVERGNILTWEQTLSERLNGVPIEMTVLMDRYSIFRRTMTVFGISAGAAFVLLASIVWWVRRKGRVRG